MKYYFISYRIELGNQSSHYGSEVIDCTPMDYVIKHRRNKKEGYHLSYWNRQILFAQEITEAEYNEYRAEFEND